MRIGSGYDIHRLVEGRKLVIGGITIPYALGEDGHSDGDALLHAIIDSLLGAMALGDIGTHFPPSDDKWKDISSEILLEKTLEITKAEIVNLDCTVILERPKLLPFIPSIRENISRILNIEIGRVSVKAKTKEGMDSTGKNNSIEAFATVLLSND